MKIKKIISLFVIASFIVSMFNINVYADANKRNIDDIIQIVSEYYNNLYDNDGKYSVTVEFEDSIEYQVYVRYAMSDEEAEERIKNGLSVMANVLVDTIFVNKKTGEIYNINKGIDINYLSKLINTENNSDWKEAYTNYIIQDVDPYGYEGYALIDINGDEIPELYILGNSTASGDIVCTYNNGNVIELYGWIYGTSYVKGENLLSISGGHMDVYFDYIYKIENGEFVQVHKGDYGAEDNSHVKFDEEGNPVYVYSWDEKIINELQYNELLYLFYGKYYPRYAHEEVCDREAIIDKIKNYKNIGYTPELKVLLNGSELSFVQPPYRAEDGSVMVPLRTAFEAMGANVYWNDQYKAAFVEYGSKGIIFTHDKLKFYIVSKNGNELSCHTETLDTLVVEHNGRTFIPLRNLAESIGCNVDWDNDTQTANVSIDINNKGKDFSAYEFEKINALYYAIVNTDPFKEYTDEIFSILKGRNILVDSIAFSWTDITYGIKKFLGLSFDDESMYEEYSQMCLNKVLAKVPNGASETVDTDIITFLQDKVTDGVSIATEYFGASSTETKLLESTIDKMGKVIDWSAFTVEQIDKLMKDYGNNIAYLKVLQDNCNDYEYLGIIYSLMGDYTDKWYRSVLDINNKLVDDAFDMGLDVGVGFYTVGLYPIADFAKDIVNKSIGLDKKTDAITDLYSVCYLLPLFKNSYSSTRSNLMNDSSAFEDFRAAFEINKAADIFAYECIKDFASSKEDTDIADERYKALKNMSYILWKAQ